MDFAIRQCERELRAQQLTLDHLNARNVAFRDSFKKVDTNSDESEVSLALKAINHVISMDKPHPMPSLPLSLLLPVACSLIDVLFMARCWPNWKIKSN